MKMVKSLLLGTAAGFVAIAGAQAADLPVKAKPVQYVKICSLYGAGFYYIPGTDMCLKIGGWVRGEYAYGDNGNMAWGWANGNVNNRSTNNSTFRARGYITADARNQTEYGTVRSYIAVGLNTNDVGLNTAANQFSANRAFIQMAGFTFGVAQSFFDFYSVPTSSYWGAFPASDTGDPGWMVMGYTMQFGNGFSATISAEERRMTQIINSGQILSAAGFGSIVPGGFTTTLPGVSANAGAYGGFNVPDLVGNLRVDGTWGSAQIMGALHDVNATYNAATAAGAALPAGPSDAWGFAVGGGIKLNLPMIGPGDYFQAQVNYTEGASRYVFMTPNGNWGKVDGGNEGYGILSDAVFSTLAPDASLQLTTAWGVDAAFEHYWNKKWQTSLYGGYAAVSYNDTANKALCATEATPSGVPAYFAVAGCDNNWSTWWVGSRTQFNLNSQTSVGLDVMYSKLMTATPNAAGIIPANGGGGTGPIMAGVPAGTGMAVDVDNWAARFRVNRNFYP